MRKLQKTVSFLLSFILALGLCIATVPGEVKAAEGVQFTVNASPAGELRRGDTFEVAVSMSGNTLAYALSYELAFDSSQLEPVGELVEGDVFKSAGATGNLNEAFNKKSIVAAVASTKAPLNNGTLMTATFKVKDTATAGTMGFQSVIDLVGEYGDSLPAPADNAGSIKVDVVTPVITLDKTVLNLVKGGTDRLTATLKYTDETVVKWTSDNTAVATVDNAGNVTAVSGGSATITAQADGVSASCAVNVSVRLEGISIQTPEVEVVRGKTVELKVVYEPKDTTEDKSVVWESSDEKIAAVDPTTGIVTGVKEGTATITARTTKAAKECTATAKVNVKEVHLTKELGEKIEFGKAEAILKGQSVQMSQFLNVKEIVGANGITDTYEIKWAVSDEEVASIDTVSGVLKGVKEGTVKVKAVITFFDGAGKAGETVEREMEMEVKEIPLDSIAFDKVIKEMVVGTEETLTIIYNPDNTTDLKDVVWASSDPAILSVENGRVKALKAGEAEITATVGEKKASCKITVKEGSVTPTPGQDKADGTKTDGTKADGTKTGNSPKTGDTANVVWYAVMFLLSLVAVLFVYKRRFCKAGR